MDERDQYSLEKMKSVFAAAPCGVGIFAAVTREPLFLNNAYYRLVGYTPEEYRQLISNEDRKLFYPPDEPMSERVAQRYASDGCLAGVQYRVVQKDGGVCWVELNMISVTVDGGDCALCFFEDITAEKENFAQMKLVAESIGSSICVMRVKGEQEQLLYANNTFYQLTGVDPKVYNENPRAFDQVFASDRDIARTRDAFLKSIQTGQPQELTYRFLGSGREPMWMERRLSAVPQDEADTYLMVSIATDITKKKQAELMLALEQRRYRLVIKEMNAAVFEWDLETGGFYSSDGYQEYAMSTVPPYVLLANEGPADVIHPDDSQAMLQFFADTKSGAPRAEAILRLKLVSGDYRWCKIIGLFYNDEQGRATRTLGIIIDINEEREKSFMLDSLLNELPGGVAAFKVGTSLDCLYFNDGFAKLTGRSRKELESLLQGDFLEHTISPADLPNFRKKMNSTARSGASINHTFRFINKSGEQGWLHMTASKLREENGFPVYYCVFTVPSEEATLFRSIVEDSAGGVLVAERKTHRIIYCNRKMRELYRVKPDINVVGRLVPDVIHWRSALLSDSEVAELTSDHFAEFHRPLDNLYFAIRAKALNWNGTDSYILYVSDETREHQKRMQQEELLNRVPMGIGIYEIMDGQLKQIYMNDSYYRIIGMPREKRILIGKTGFIKLVHPDDVATVYAAVEKCVNGADSQSLNHRILCGDGNYRWFRLDASVVKREPNKITIYCGYVNIDLAVTAQQALQKQHDKEQTQRKLLEQDSLLSIEFNVTRDCLISYQVNQGLIDEFDKGTAGGVIRPNIAAKVPTEEERRISADFFDRDKAISRFKNGINEFSAEYRRRMNNGRLYWVRSTCRLERDRDSGDLISYTYVHNIDTERKKELAAESVIDEETDFVMLLSTVSSTATLLRLRDNYLDTGWKLYTEFPFSSVPSEKTLGNVEPEDRAAVCEFFNEGFLLQRLESEPVATLIYRQHLPNGLIRRKKSRAFYLDSIREDIVVERRDITDIYEEEQKQQRTLQKALDEANAANRAKSEFLSRMSHDLRTPMNVIIGLTSLAMDKATHSSEMKETLSDISNSSKYLLNLINDCLDMEKITGGKIELHPAPYPYAKFHNNIKSVIEPLCREKNIELIMDKEADIQTVIIADQIRLEQIFYNLLSNAVKFTPDGGRIELLTQTVSRENGYVTNDCIVRDNGIGMSEEFQKQMFEPFTQETDTVSAEYQGSGLGLAIVKQLADLMGAVITVNSRLGQGTEFIIRFRFPVAPEAVKTEKETVLVEMERLRGKRVLLAEDNPLNAKIAVKLLEKAGITAVTAANGQSALENFSLVSENYYDAVLMDIRMPVMNGLDAARAIRALDRGDAKTVPIIAMTANAFDTDVEESLCSGMNAHLSKPIEPAKLYEALFTLTS